MKKSLLAQLMFGCATKRNPAVRGGQRQLRPLRFQNLGGFHAPATRDGCEFSGSVGKMMIDALERPSNWSWIVNDPESKISKSFCLASGWFGPACQSQCLVHWITQISNWQRGYSARSTWTARDLWVGGFLARSGFVFLKQDTSKSNGVSWFYGYYGYLGVYPIFRLSHFRQIHLTFSKQKRWTSLAMFGVVLNTFDLSNWMVSYCWILLTLQSGWLDMVWYVLIV